MYSLPSSHYKQLIYSKMSQIKMIRRVNLIFLLIFFSGYNYYFAVYKLYIISILEHLHFNTEDF